MIQVFGPSYNHFQTWLRSNELSPHHFAYMRMDSLRGTHGAPFLYLWGWWDHPHCAHIIDMIQYTEAKEVKLCGLHS